MAITHPPAINPAGKVKRVAIFTLSTKHKVVIDIKKPIKPIADSQYGHLSSLLVKRSHSTPIIRAPVIPAMNDGAP